MRYAGVEYKLEEYEQGDGPDFSRESWMSVKPTMGLDFPNLPYFIDGDFKITETLAILKYVADKWKPELLGKDAQHRAMVNMAAFKVHELKMKVTGPCYMSGNLEEINQAIKDLLPGILAFMGNNKFVAGNEPSYVDFHFFELVNKLQCLTGGELFKNYPVVDAYNTTMKDLAGLKEYLPTCEEQTKPFNNKVAKLNGTMNY